MNQTTSMRKGSSLLNYAIPRLIPEVFLHPIWIHFGNKEAFISLSKIDDLLYVAKNMQEYDPSGACQVLLICAFYQNNLGQRHKALIISQQAYSLAERTGLSKETIWAIWGICAICVQQGNYEQATNHLVDLQAALIEQNEWIVADLVEVIKQFFRNPMIVHSHQYFVSPRNQPLNDLLAFTFDWLEQWGISANTYKSESDTNEKQSKLKKRFFSLHHWQNHWYTFMQVIKDVVKLRRAERDVLHKNIPAIQPANEVHSPNPNSSTYQRKSDFVTEKLNTNHLVEKTIIGIPIAVHMLGSFNMAIGDLTVKLPASRSLSVLKYLLFHHKQSVPREVLMDIFWPDSNPEAARNNLNVALYNLRQAIRAVTNLPVILFGEGAYGLSPSLQVWLDTEEFERRVESAQRLESRDQLTSAIAEYEAALSLYQGDFLEHSLYDEWTILYRERLRIKYLDTLDNLSQIYFIQERYAACITICQLILIHECCREDAHCLLMRCYCRQGQYYLALRQYQICIEALRVELEVEPASETKKLYHQIRHHQFV